MKTSIVVLSNNNIEQLKITIETIYEFTDKENVEIIVIDNNSVDGTVDYLKEESDIKAVFNSSDVNYAQAYNSAINLATGDSILFLHGDMALTKNSINNLIKCLYSSNEVGMVGPATNSSSRFQSIGSDAKNLNEILSFAENYNVTNKNLWFERITLCDSCFLIKREIIEKVGLFDETLGNGYYTLDDYCYRIRQEGFKLIFCKDTYLYNFENSVFFKNENSSKDEDKFFEKKWGFRPSYSNGIRKDIIDIIGKNTDKNISVLEVGCSCGGTLLEIKNIYKNAELYGLELNSYAAKCAGLVAEVKQGNIETDELNFEENKFDYILFGDVLEHLYDPKSVIEKIRRILKPTGKVIASIPNVMHYSVLKSLILGRWKYEDAGILDKTHIRFFTYTEIIEMFKDANYGEMATSCNVIPMSQQDEEFIKILTSISNENFEIQYKAYQYLVTASKLDKNSLLDLCLNNIILNIDEEKTAETIKNYSSNEILYYIKSKVNNKLEVLNAIAVYNYNHGKSDEVIPFLSEAFSIDNKYKDTLFNLGIVLYSVGEYDMAKNYFESIENKDQVTNEYLDAIKSKI